MHIYVASYSFLYRPKTTGYTISENGPRAAGRSVTIMAQRDSARA